MKRLTVPALIIGAGIFIIGLLYAFVIPLKSFNPIPRDGVMGSVCPGFLATGPEAQATSDALGKGSYHVLLGQLDRYDAATSYARENVDALGCSSSPASYKLYL